MKRYIQLAVQKALSYLQSSQPLRYLFIGGTSYMVELSALLSLESIFSFSPEAAVACSFWIGLITSFTLQKYITFDSKGSDKKMLGRQAFLYGSLVLFNYFFTIVFVSLTTDLIGLVAARTVALLLTVSWNYFVYKRIFK